MGAARGRVDGARRCPGHRADRALGGGVQRRARAALRAAELLAIVSRRAMAARRAAPRLAAYLPARRAGELGVQAAARGPTQALAPCPQRRDSVRPNALGLRVAALKAGKRAYGLPKGEAGMGRIA
jgi:hypothetical protein